MGSEMCIRDSSHATPEDEEEGSFVDRIAAPEDTTPEVNVQNGESTSQLYQALTSLPAREAVVLRLRFGLDESHTHTLAEISQRLGLTRTQVRVREQRALSLLRKHLQHQTVATKQHKQETQLRCKNAA